MKNNRLWKFVYIFCCLVYMGWVTSLGSYELDRILGQYRSVVDSLNPDRINVFALKELTKECLRQQGVSSDWKVQTCSEWPSSQVEARRKKIKEGLIQTKERYELKLVLFCISFVVFFLLIPPALFYLLIIGVIKLKNTIKIVK